MRAGKRTMTRARRPRRRSRARRRASRSRAGPPGARPERRAGSSAVAEQKNVARPSRSIVARRSGVPKTNRTPSPSARRLTAPRRPAPPAAGRASGGSPRWSSGTRRAFSAYTVATPEVASVMPARAGPTTEAVWKRIEFSPMALGRCSRGTRLGRSDCRAGASARPAAAPKPATSRIDPGIRHVRRRHQRQRRGDQHHHHLGDQHEPPAIDGVRHHAAPEPEHENRADPRETDQTERQRLPARRGEERDVPEDRRPLHHRARHRHELAQPEQAEVPVAQRDERRRGAPRTRLGPPRAGPRRQAPARPGVQVSRTIAHRSWSRQRPPIFR